MNLNLTYLKYFYDTARLGSATSAARENFVTQSAVSQGITKLERYFARPLLTHKRNSIKLTDEGRAVFESCRRLFAAVEDVKNTLNTSENTYSGKLDLACFNSVAVSLLPDVLVQFQKIAPEVSLNFFTGRPELVLNWFRESRAEIAIISGLQDYTPYNHECLFKGYFRVYESIHRRKEPIERCIFTESSPEVHYFKESYFKNYGKQIHTHMEITSWEVIVNLILSNVGVGLIPDYLVKAPYRKKLLRPAKLDYDPLPYSLYAIYPKDEALSKNARLFLDCFKKAV